jgi:cell division protein ZapA
MSASKKASSKTPKSDGNLVPITVFGQTYSVRAEEDSVYIEKIARYVDTKMRTLAESTGTTDSLKVAVLAALNIADEFFKLDEEHRAAERELLATTEELSKALDESLREPTQTSPALP